MTKETLFSDEVSFHDTATIIVSASRKTLERSIGGQVNTDEITLHISTAISVSLDLTAEEANNLSRALAAAAKAISTPETELSGHSSQHLLPPDSDGESR